MNLFHNSTFSITPTQCPASKVLPANSEISVRTWSENPQTFKISALACVRLNVEATNQKCRNPFACKISVFPLPLSSIISTFAVISPMCEKLKFFNSSFKREIFFGLTVKSSSKSSPPFKARFNRPEKRFSCFSLRFKSLKFSSSGILSA